MNIRCLTKILLIVDDSGGSVIIYSTDAQQYELVAIVNSCNVCTSEGIFTQIIPYSDWISEIMKSSSATLPTFSPRLSTSTLTRKPDLSGEFCN